jgi:UDP-glucose 4-epimerase
MIGPKVLVTGGAGFIGSHLVDKLVAEGSEVVVLDSLHSGKKSNLNESIDDITFIKGDIRNHSLIKKLVRESNVVFHLAANASVPYSVKNPMYDFEVNVIGTFNLLKASINSKLERFVYASSAAVYGEPEYTPIDEKHPLRPISPYGSTKLSGEILGFSFKKTYEIPFVAARIFNVYGPRQPRYVMFDFYRKLRENPNELKVLGDGEQVRDFCYVSDAVKALLLIAERGDGVYNVAGGNPIPIKKLARIMVSQLAPGAEIIYGGRRWPGDINNLTADISKLEMIGFRPDVELGKGINLLIKWFDENLVCLI